VILGWRDHGDHPPAQPGAAKGAAVPASSAWVWPRPCRAGKGLGAGRRHDSIDGVEDNAGARVSPCTLKRAAELSLRISDHLDRNDACSYFSALGDLVITGPTHTNVNDFRAILIL
jgi:hydroxypyruvate reductase